MKSIFLGGIVLASLVSLGVYGLKHVSPKSDLVREPITITSSSNVATATQTTTSSTPNSSEGAETSSQLVIWPVDRPLERVTKKPFGLKVSPTNSPVTPERFSGYHTAVDFETFPEEAETDVRVKAVCDGALLIKRTATGYGGVAVQACDLDGQAVTVVYGHVKLTSLQAKVGSKLTQGKAFAVLGKGFSPETDRERKHLHLGIHQGAAIDLRGYVQTEGELKAWIDLHTLVSNK